MITIRLEYLRHIRKLRLIEYLKGACIQPEWMILSLLPVLPPDLRPIIANPRGYITGDINIHYQNIVYRNNMIERLSNAFWIPKKLVSLKQIYEHFNFPLKHSIFPDKIKLEKSIGLSRLSENNKTDPYMS